MKNKGFTLVELMAVITILGIIMLIAVPAVTHFLAKSKDTYFDQTIENIETATEEYLVDYPEKVPESENEYTQILLKTLIDGGYIDNVKNKDTKQECNEDSVITVTSKGKKTQQEGKTGANTNLDIKVCLKCGSMNSPSSSCTDKGKVSFADSSLNSIDEYNILKDSKYSPTLVKIGDPNQKISNTNVNIKIYDTSVVNFDKSTFTFKALKTGSTVIEATVVVDGDTYVTSIMIYVSSSAKAIDNLFISDSKLTNYTASTLLTKDIQYDEDTNLINNDITITSTTNKNLVYYAYATPTDENRSVDCSIIDENGVSDATATNNDKYSCNVNTGTNKVTYEKGKKNNVYLYVRSNYVDDEDKARKIPLSISLTEPDVAYNPSSVTLKSSISSKNVYVTIISKGRYPIKYSNTSCWGSGLTCTKSGTSYIIKRTASNDSSCSGGIKTTITYTDDDGVDHTILRSMSISCKCYCKKSKVGIKSWRLCSECY